MRPVRPQTRGLLPGPGQVGSELLLPGLRRAGRRPRRPPHERRWAGHRRRVAEAFLAALQPAALQACLAAAEALEDGHDAALDQWRRQVEQARYAAAKAERRYRAVDPDNRLVARGLETEWEQALRDLADADGELARRQAKRPRTLTADERAAILALGDDLQQVWALPTTTDKDRKQLLRTLLDEVNITIRRGDPEPHADLVLRWKGGAISDLTVPLRRPQPRIRTAEDTIALIRRLAVHYPDAKIAGILNRQHRRTARGLSYTASRVNATKFGFRRLGVGRRSVARRVWFRCRWRV